MPGLNAKDESKGQQPIGDAKAAAGRADALGGQSIATIRDIIFGREMQTYEERFTTLEQRLASEAAALRTSLSARLDDLEQRLGAEEKSRGEAVSGASEALEQRLAGEARRLQQTFEQALSELSARLSAEAASIRDEKAGRGALAELLRQAADDIAGETTKVPAPAPPRR